MTLESLETERLNCKVFLQQDIVHAKGLLSKNLQNENLSGLSIKLNECVNNLNINCHNLEQIHEKLSLATTNDNEEEILKQIENDFDCIISAIDIRIELEVFDKETKYKIKDLETSAKILPLAKKLDNLLSKSESQMKVLRTNQLKLMETIREYSKNDSQLKHESMDVERKATINSYTVGGEDADGSIRNTIGKANEITLGASKSSKQMDHSSSCEIPVGHGVQIAVQMQKTIQETLVTVSVASNGALQIQKLKRQKQRKRKKNKVKFSASSKRTLNSRNWRKSRFHRKQRLKKRKPGFRKGKKVLQRKKAAKKRRTDHTHKGQSAHGVWNRVPICHRLWWKQKLKTLFIKVERACHRRKAIQYKTKMGKNKRKKGSKKSVGVQRRHKCSRGNVKTGKTQSTGINKKIHTD